MMSITIDATYEGGVLKPAQPLPLSEHAQVRVTVEEQTATVDHRDSSGVGVAARCELSAVEKIIARARALPDEVVAQWPTDGASQHDHYLYGWPKRTDLRDEPE